MNSSPLVSQAVAICLLLVLQATQSTFICRPVSCCRSSAMQRAPCMLQAAPVVKRSGKVCLDRKIDSSKQGAAGQNATRVVAVSGVPVLAMTKHGFELMRATRYQSR